MSGWDAMVFRRILLPAVVAVLGVAGSVMLYLKLQEQEAALLQARLRLDADVRVRAIERRVSGALGVLDSMLALYVSSVEVERHEFRAFALHALARREGIDALAWAPRVPADERASHESATADEGFPDYAIRERGPDDGLAPAGARDWYVPVRFIEPLVERQGVLGFDLASERRRAEALTGAAASARTVATAPIRPVLREAGESAYLVFAPVYSLEPPPKSPEQRLERLGGFVVGMYSPSTMLGRAMELFPPVGINVEVLDVTDGADTRLYQWQSGEPIEPAAVPSAVGGVVEHGHLDVAGRRWLVRCTPTQRYVSAHRTYVPVGALAAGLIITLLVTGFFLDMGSREAQVTGEVDERTRELTGANAALQAEIARRAELEDELIRSRFAYQTVVDNVPSMIWYKDRDSRFVLVNRAAAATADMTPDQIIDKTDHEVYPEFAERYIADDREVIRSGQPKLRIEEPHVIGTGEQRWMRTDKVPVRDDDGEVIGLIVVATDITERKRAELELAEKANELEDLNAQLERSNEELDSFAYIASHDLKEPLRGLHNYATFLQEDYGEKFDGEARQWLEALTRLTKRMEELINSLLYYSRVGRTDLAVEPVDLNKIVTEVLERLGPALKERQVEPRVPRPLPTMQCDRVRVCEVFANLVTNASKYNDKEQKWVEIGCVDPDDRPAETGTEPSVTGEQTVFYVRDNGIGIPEDRRDQVFEMFKRLHGREKFGGGTGAGLTIVKKIVQRHGGDIWVQSAEGEGTTFYFTLGTKDHE